MLSYVILCYNKPEQQRHSMNPWFWVPLCGPNFGTSEFCVFLHVQTEASKPRSQQVCPFWRLSLRILAAQSPHLAQTAHSGGLIRNSICLLWDKARPGQAKAGLGKAKPGQARPSQAMPVQAKPRTGQVGEARRVKASQASPCQARPGQTRPSQARPSEARRGEAHQAVPGKTRRDQRRGKARAGQVKRNKAQPSQAWARPGRGQARPGQARLGHRLRAVKKRRRQAIPGQ